MNNIYPIVLKPMGVARGSHIVKKVAAASIA